MFPVSTGINRDIDKIILEKNGVPRKYGDKPPMRPQAVKILKCSP
ncbi:conserved hypothetical protein [Xenorhabdus nematophila ATCC 19061]|uniref:Uncharacterized protein n=1 Tax=Xenorhabdus nematophila (strain ATCC 19061 / DSM 3370 / CCUG 14189 / LMG 1036 / NCIMB 9965 / AN6) TaxID=406817 RepID=D3VAW8_XENNA|nr:conserved hypothetical protein [Xenorhabdus nematophila ATCC 19061]CEK24561.1 conserved hypothetical protein [Xenorhabdus nematophila AN6/1]